ncbi:MAG: twin-arginine translocase subunit TatC [Haloarculaceae archaeon]
MVGPLSEDTTRTIANGRATVGSVLSAAQSRLKYVFLVFVVSFLGAFWGMGYIWDTLRADLVEALNLPPGEQAEVVAVTPFDVILLQVKIGLIVGVFLTIPALVWFGRKALKARGYWPSQRVPRWKLAGLGTMITVLFAVGLVYAYELFFPLMFDFLANNAVDAGFNPTYSIVKWTQFIAFLALSFGLAAQLPLGMSSLASAGIVKYETFRDKWRYAVVGIVAFGALFSPPDPFTQIMWATPLVGLYAFSLGVTKLVVLAQRAGESVPLSEVVRNNWNVLAGVFVLGAGGVFYAIRQGGLSAFNGALRTMGSGYRLPTADILSLLGLSPTISAAIIGVVVGLVALGIALFYFRIKALERLQVRAEVAGPGEPEIGEPAEIDLGALSTPAVRAAPAEAFAELTEEDALGYASEAMEADNPEKAQAILDRFDEAQAAEADRAGGEGEAGGATTDDDSDTVTATAAGMVDAFTDEETTEDDIGGYYYDISFIVDSLTSKAVWLVAVFMLVLAASFVWLYSGGIGLLVGVLTSNMPPALQPEVEIVTLHPVEALIFEVKFSTLLAAVSIVPLMLYWAWPAVQERGLAGGDRNVLLVWGGTLLVALIGGSVVGFLYIAPAIISFLSQDALTAHMVIAYRINHFGWLVIFLTVGIGVLAEIPVTMLLFDRGNILSYGTFRRRWRIFVIGVFVISSLLSPQGVFSMFIFALPAVLAFGVGLGLLWLVSLPRRRRRRKRPQAAD